jgi:hypothetical protein
VAGRGAARSCTMARMKAISITAAMVIVFCGKAWAQRDPDHFLPSDRTFELETKACKVLASAPGRSPPLVQEAAGFGATCIYADDAVVCSMDAKQGEATTGKKTWTIKFDKTFRQNGFSVMISDDTVNKVMINFGTGAFTWTSTQIFVKDGAVFQKHCTGTVGRQK